MRQQAATKNAKRWFRNNTVYDVAQVSEYQQMELCEQTPVLKVMRYLIHDSLLQLFVQSFGWCVKSEKANSDLGDLSRDSWV